MERIQRLQKLLNEVTKELSHVTWPNKKDMTMSVMIVTVAVFITGAVFFAADYFLYNLVQFLIKL